MSRGSVLGKDEVKVPKIAIGESYSLEDSNGCYRFVVEWLSSHGIICDLDLNIMCYDERGRFIERLSNETARSRDDSITLMADIDLANQTNDHLEIMTVDFQKVDPSTQAMVLFLDGGPRNFQYIQGIVVKCMPYTRVGAEETFLTNSSNEKKGQTLFELHGRCRKDFQGIMISAIYKEGWCEDGNPQWHVTSVMEPMHVAAIKEKEEKCDQLVVNIVPALEKFKPRLFVNVRAICTALSSHSLPKLKKKFTINGALSIGQFTEVLFKQLASTHPRVTDDAEAGYTVAMLQEMFHQIDFNGDTTVDWDEFTTFCIQTGLQVSSTAEVPTGSSQSDTLDEYVIEYGEELLMRDRVLSPHRYITLMRYVPEIHKLLVIPEDSDNVFIFDEKFKLKSHLYPNKVQVIGVNSGGGKSGGESSSSSSASADASSLVAGNVNPHGRIMIYDTIYLTGRELYAYCASDHTITICKEQQIGARVNYIQHNRFFHSLLHLKLCWSAKSKVLCSVASDKVIYGWDIDSDKPTFQISRHSDLITDMIAIDHFELFATCSMDKRIVLWSSTTRRVKGVLLGHKRGVRCMDVFESTLLSAGFETEAKTWDLVSKDCVAILKGHRRPVAAAKLMCQRAQSEEEHRAITVDEGGEFRLWNVFVKERSADAALVPTLQIFEMSQPENPISNMRFLAIPNDPILSTSYYSNLIACSTKLLHFLPEKNAKEFLPPTASVFNESAACIVTAVGKGLMKYDVCTGQFVNAYSDISSHDLTALCLDGERGRRIFIGCSNGELLLANFMTGQVISSTMAHTREITCISVHSGMRHNIYTGALDGRIRMLEEDSGNIHVHNTVDNAFGEGLGIQFIKVVDLLSTVVAVSTGTRWGVWNSRTFKRMALFEEEGIITACQVIGTTLDNIPLSEGGLGPPEKATEKKVTSHKFVKKEKLLTLAFAFAGKGIYVYTLDIVGLVGVASFHLKPAIPMDVTHLEAIRFTDGASMNYSATRGPSALTKAALLVGCTDEGSLVSWEMNALRKTSEALFHKKFEGVSRKQEKNPAALLFSALNSGSNSGLNSASNSPRATEIPARQSSLFVSTSMPPGSAGKGPVSMIDLRSPHSLDSEDHCCLSVSSADSAENIKGDGEGSASRSPPHKVNRNRSVLDMTLLTQIDERNGRGGSPKRSGSGSGLMNTDQMVDQTAKTMERSLNHCGDSQMPFQSGATSPLVSEEVKQDGRKAAAAALDHNSSAFLNSRDIYGLPPEEATRTSYKIWKGHRDIISTLISLDEHGCILTVSLDGYHRVWNLDAVCLGEMPLPNITESMKNPDLRVVRKTQWKFILERIPVSSFHKSLAVQLVQDIAAASKGSRAGNAASRRGAQSMMQMNLTMNAKAGAGGMPPLVSPMSSRNFFGEDSVAVEDSAVAINRRNILKSLSEPPSLPDDAPPTQLGQSRMEKFMTQLADTKSEAGKASCTTTPSNAAATQNAAEKSTVTFETVDNDGRKSAGASRSSILPSPSAKRVGSASKVTPGGKGASRAIKSTEAKGRRSPERTPNKSPPRATKTPGTATGRTSPGGSSMGSISQGSMTSGPLENSQSANRLLSVLENSTVSDGGGTRKSGYAGGKASQHVEALWQLPSELKSASDFAVPAAFSEHSLFMAHQRGAIDGEGYRILRKVASHHDKVSVYDRATSVVMLRNPGMSISCEMPALADVRASEVNFGVQKGMYKNADKMLSERESMPRTQMRHIISLARIEQNVRRVHSMVHVMPPPAHDDVVLPKNATTDAVDPEENSRTEEMKRKYRLEMSASMVPEEARVRQRPLDKVQIGQLIDRVTDAIDHGPDWESKLRETVEKKAALKRKKTKEKISVQAREAIERRLQNAIKAKLRSDAAASGGSAAAALLQSPPGTAGSVPSTAGGGVGLDGESRAPSRRKPPTLTARALLPYYKLSDVKGFLEVFNRTDEDFTGDLNINEWVKLFSLFSKSMTAHDCRLLFLQLDTKQEGFLTFREIVPIVFSKADKKQLSMIIAYFESEIVVKGNTGSSGAVLVTAAEMEQLFDCYDTDNIGFVAVSYIRERIRSMNMPEPIQFAFMESIIDLEEDEMVNNQEFARIFKPYCSSNKKDNN